MPSNPYAADFHDASRPAANRKPLDDALIVRLYESGISENAIAIRLGVGRLTIRRRLRWANVALRDQTAAETLKWASMTVAQREAQVAAAHAAAMGRVASDDERMRIALANERSGRRASVIEGQLLSYLRTAGLRVEPQKAIGRYNIDIALPGLGVAVEVFGGGWHAQAERLRQFEQRTRYLFEAGWHVYVVWVEARRWPLIDVSQDIIAFAKEGRSLPASRRRYRVIRGNGEVVSFGSSEDQSLTFVPSTRRS